MHAEKAGFQGAVAYMLLFINVFLAWLALASSAAAWGDDAAQKALQQHQLQRQQQQEQLQLRMQQQQDNLQSPAAGGRQQQAIEQLEINQQLRQQQLHQRQARDLVTRPELPSDDEGTRRAKAQIEEQRAQAQAREQLQQFERERQAAGSAPAAK